MKKCLYIIAGLLLVLTVLGCQSKESKEEKANEKVMETRERIIEILRSTGRPGMESVIIHLDSTDFFTRGAGGHHTEPGGLAKHSLEVYRLMRSFAWFQSRESVAVVAIFHDMGKIGVRWHTWYVTKLLSDWGFELTEEERLAIFRHHNLEGKYFRHPLHRALVAADMASGGWWKLWHKNPLSKVEKANRKIQANKEKYIALVRATGRAGAEAVISHLDSTDFFTMGGGGHHTEPGGLVQHSLEVYRIMRCVSWFHSSDEIAVIALFHDMGKIDIDGWHPWRSVKHLREWGFDLSDYEYIIIFRHHRPGLKHYRFALRRSLKFADALSSGWWKLWHKSPAVEKEDVTNP